MVPAPAPAPFRFRACLQGLLRPTGIVPTMSKDAHSVPKALKWREGSSISGFDSIFLRSFNFPFGLFFENYHPLFLNFENLKIHCPPFIYGALALAPKTTLPDSVPN